MPSDDTRLPGAYLIRLLDGGVRPFRYRSGVHRLMGMPERADSAMTSTPPLPPVGFTYAERPVLDNLLGPSSSLPPPDTRAFPRQNFLAGAPMLTSEPEPGSHSTGGRREHRAQSRAAPDGSPSAPRARATTATGTRWGSSPTSPT